VIRTFVQAPRGRRRDGHFQRGQGLVEFALIVPVLMTLVLGIIVYGVTYNHYLELTGGASSSAQLLSISRGETSDPCSTTVNAFYASSPGLAKTSLTFAFNLNGTAYTGTTCAGAQSNLVAGGTVQVNVTYPCNVSFMGMNPLPNCTLKGQDSERIQ
jgi:Flp pilus assembly protein TadG